MTNENNNIEGESFEPDPLISHNKIAIAGNAMAGVALALLTGTAIRHGLDPGVAGDAARFLVSRAGSVPGATQVSQAAHRVVDATVPAIESTGSDLGQASVRLGKGVVEHPVAQTSFRRAERVSRPVRGRVVGNPYKSGPYGHPKNLPKRMLKEARNIPEVQATEAQLRVIGEEQLSKGIGQAELASFSHRVALEEIGIQAGLDIEDATCDPPRIKPVICEHGEETGIARIAEAALRIYTAAPDPDLDHIRRSLEEAVRPRAEGACLYPEEPLSLRDLIRLNRPVGSYCIE